MSVHVIATTPEGTRAALIAARPLITRGPIIVVVPATGARDPQEFGAAAALYRRIAASLDQPIRLRFCVCRTPAGAARIVPAHATLVVGGAARRWWRTREERVAAAIRRGGREVVFAEVTREAARA
jgi:hypothetical protein